MQKSLFYEQKNSPSRFLRVHSWGVMNILFWWCM